MTKTRTAGSAATPLSMPLTQRSNQRRRTAKKSSARLPSSVACGAELDIAGERQRAVAMRPRPEHQPHRSALAPRQARCSSPSRCARRGRTSPTDAPSAHRRSGRNTPRRRCPGCCQNASNAAVRPLLEQVILVVGRGLEWRIALAPRHSRHPAGDVLGFERGLHLRVARVGERVAIRPGRLLQIERAAVADAAAIGVGEAAAIEVLRGKTRRVEAAQRHLRMRRIGKTHRRDPAVAPGLRHQPIAGVVAVRRLAQILGEAALGTVAPAAILIDDGVAGTDEIAPPPLRASAASGRPR